MRNSVQKLPDMSGGWDMFRFDGVDLKILELLQQNARMSLKEISARVYLTSPAVSARIDKLEQAGVIEGYHACVNPAVMQRLQRENQVRLRVSA